MKGVWLFWQNDNIDLSFSSVIQVKQDNGYKGLLEQDGWIWETYYKCVWPLGIEVVDTLFGREITAEIRRMWSLAVQELCFASG